MLCNENLKYMILAKSQWKKSIITIFVLVPVPIYGIVAIMMKLTCSLPMKIGDEDNYKSEQINTLTATSPVKPSSMRYARSKRKQFM